MTLSLELAVGSDLTLDRENLTIVRKFRVLGTLPYTQGGDAFDTVASAVMGLVRVSYPTYGTPMGTLYWNSIQLHENFYAQHYDISVTYSPWQKETGTYQITVDQAVGNTHITAGELIGCFPAASAPTDETGVFFDGNEVVGSETPVNEDRITISYRHPQMWLNAAYRRRIGALRGYPNSDIFLGYAPGEVRYMGGQFTESDCEATASYNFEISPNVTNLVVAGITIASKTGFDVLQPVFEKDVGTTSGGAKHAIAKPKYIKVIRPKAWAAYQTAFGWGGS